MSVQVTNDGELIFRAEDFEIKATFCTERLMLPHQCNEPDKGMMNPLLGRCSSAEIKAREALAKCKELEK